MLPMLISSFCTLQFYAQQADPHVVQDQTLEALEAYLYQLPGFHSGIQWKQEMHAIWNNNQPSGQHPSSQNKQLTTFPDQHDKIPSKE